MTDAAKAIVFAKECLKWHEPAVLIRKGYLILSNGVPGDAAQALDFQQALETFLSKRFFIQINRGTTSLFQWSVIVGPQNLLRKPPVFDHGRGDSDDLFDAIFDACVVAARLYPDY